MTQAPTAPAPPLAGRSALLGPILTYGFGTSVAVWCAWFVTHLPWLRMPEQGSLPILLAVWLAGMVVAGLRAGPRAGAPWLVGLGAGLVTAIPGLLVLGSRTEAAAPGVAALRPANLAIAGGFLVLGAVLGLIGGAIGGVLRGQRPAASSPDWLARFAVVAAAAVAPLLFIGGLVTSTDSGMAVPDWPNTFGTNMFLYPLGPRANTDPAVYLEHSHRLFGSLVGLTTLLLMVYVLLAEKRRWLKILTVVAFVLVCVQGILGGVRVLENQRLLAMLHGVLAQLTFGVLIAVAVYLSPTFKTSALSPSDPHAKARQVRVFATALLHSTLVQLLFGAMFRHFRDNHSLWSHLGFSVVVTVAAMLAGFLAVAVHGHQGGIGPVLRRSGKIVLAVVALQFTLGWITFLLGVKNMQAENVAQALVRTAHQANGGLLLGMATITFLWSRRLSKLYRLAATQPPQMADK